jgi:hypothetical protein
LYPHRAQRWWSWEMPLSFPVDARWPPIPSAPTIGILPPRSPRDTLEVVNL